MQCTRSSVALSISLAAVGLIAVGAAPALAGEIAFAPLEPGLSLATLVTPPPALEGVAPPVDPAIYILRIDPKRFALKLLTAAARGEEPATARDWAHRMPGVRATINANMYQKDHRTSVSLMYGPGFVNNPRLSKDNTVLLFDRKPGGDKAGGSKASVGPKAHIVDRSCEPFDTLRPRYRAAVQSIRMIDCEGATVWAKQPRRYSHAIIGEDAEGHLLFIFSRAAWRTHDFVNYLRALPLQIVRLQYGDGGPPAQFYLKAGGVEVNQHGAYEGKLRRHLSLVAWPIPNVLAVVPR